MADKINFLAILVLILTYFTQIRSETCTFKRTPDTTGLGDGEFKGQKTIDQCEEACQVDSSCVAIYHQDSICFFALDKRTSSRTGTIHSLKVCTPDTTVPTTQDTPKPTTPEPIAPEPTTPESTTPKPTTSGTNTGGIQTDTPKPTTPEPTTPETTIPESTTPKPTASGTNTGGIQTDTLKPTTPEPTTPEQTTPEPTTPKPTTSGTNTGRSQTETCTFKRTLITTGLGDGKFKGQKTIVQCEETCRVDSSCVAIYHQDSICYFALDERTSSRTGTIHSLKVCTPDTTVPTTQVPVIVGCTVGGVVSVIVVIVICFWNWRKQKQKTGQDVSDQNVTERNVYSNIVPDNSSQSQHQNTVNIPNNMYSSLDNTSSDLQQHQHLQKQENHITEQQERVSEQQGDVPHTNNEYVNVPEKSTEDSCPDNEIELNKIPSQNVYSSLSPTDNNSIDYRPYEHFPKQEKYVTEQQEDVPGQYENVPKQQEGVSHTSHEYTNVTK